MTDRAERPAPRPETIRFFGTSWVERGTGYWLRRAAVGTGALVAACAGALVMRFGVQGVFMAGVGRGVDLMLVAGVMVCTTLAAIRTWNGFCRGRSSPGARPADQRSAVPLLAIGFVGMLVAYFLRNLVEAPGEAEKRRRYELATAAHARRRAPATSGGGGGGRRGRR